MITVNDATLRFGARVLMSNVSFRVDTGDKIGLVGRNGAGKTTLTRMLSGDGQPSEGTITHRGKIGYLPQDPKIGDLSTTARDRILGARGLDEALSVMRKAEIDMGSADPETSEKAMRAYGRAQDAFAAGGGYAAEAEAATISAALGLPDRVLEQPLSTLSGGQRRRIELARILFSDAETMLLDEPTNHLDADSVTWLRGFLKSYSGGLVIISHDVELIEETVNKVLYLDGNRATIDIYNMGWKHYVRQREADEVRRKREREITTKTAERLQMQGNKMRAKASKATAAQQMLRRAEDMMAGLEGVRQSEKVAKIDFPSPAACGKTPLMAEGLSKSYGSLEIFTDVNLAIDRGSRVVVLGFNGAGKTTLLRMLAGELVPDSGELQPGHGLKIGYFAQEHETLDPDRTVLQNMQSTAPDLTDTQARSVLGAFLFTGDDAEKPARVLSGGEKTRLALAGLIVSSANVLLLDEPTNNLDPASREEVLSAIRRYQGAIVLVSHDEGAVQALEPDRVLLLPDGDEDLWNDDYADLIALA
ncbi:ribosomal protection-like ABC-F family protein [Aeromicrobium sp. Sec7.5]|uniref:ribosomal protection-like ABC-F family protein n=1 Tax=Aeromicrobium sp. Sec7.5 TaxID=3121276 RepID=UPI002FE46B45